MVDPLSEVIALLQPGTVFSKGISGAGRWGVRYAAFGHPSFCAVLEGSCRLAVDGEEPLTLQAGDFDAALLVSLLPRLIHVCGEPRLAMLVGLVGDEARQTRAGRDLVLARLVEILLVEALRSTTGARASTGLLRGLADPRLALAIRQMHADPARPWTVEQLGRAAALSRSAFFERFSRAVGMPPMQYLLSWRMALAKDLLRRNGQAVAEVAERVGYSSASTFSTAFSRHVGQPPARYARSA
jgi:AraC-like DNA-binding protein